MHLLLYLVNDILDFKTIEENKFIKKAEIFSPRKTFEFIKSLFLPQAEMQNTQISIDLLPSLRPQDPRNILSDGDFGESLETRQRLLLPLASRLSVGEVQFPEFLIGDQLRMQ